jgi:hypothetical protein
MFSRRLVIIVGLLLIVFALWSRFRAPLSIPKTTKPLPVVSEKNPPPSIQLEDATLTSSPAVSPSQLPGKTQSASSTAARDFTNPLVAASFDQAPRPASPTDPATEAEFSKVSFMFRDYRAIAGENPVGTNAEIMKAMMGANPKGLTLGPPPGQLLNGKGELLDPWQTPYFFHQVTKDLMEIHSAGPDHQFGTADDLLSQ